MPQCILFQVEPRLLFGKKRFAFGNSFFGFKAFGTFWYDTKKNITCISQRVITLLVQRTSGEENYSFSEFSTRFGRVDDC